MPGRPPYWKRAGLTNETVEAEDLTVGFKDINLFDDFFYDAEPVNEFDTEGTFATVAGVGGQAKWTSGAVAGNRCRVGATTNGVLDSSKKILIRCRGGITTSIADITHFIGAYAALPTAANPPVESAEAVEFRAVRAGSTVNWFGVIRHSSTESTVDMGVAVDLDVLHNFEIKLENGVATFTLDGVVKSLSGANIPTGNLIPAVVLVTTSANARAFLIDSLLISNSRT